MKMISLTIVTVLAGCATYKPPVEKQIEKVTIVKKDFEKTWTAIVKVLAEKNIPFKTIDKSSGIITSDSLSFSPAVDKKIIDCGTISGMNLANETGKVVYSIFAEKYATETKVSINLKPSMITTVTVGYSTQSAEKPCFSTGQFEKELFDKIKN